MKLFLTVLTALLFATLPAYAQANPEVANAGKAARRAWEDAPADKKAMWLQLFRRITPYLNAVKELQDWLTGLLASKIAVSRQPCETSSWA
jgi:hypothetical protein